MEMPPISYSMLGSSSTSPVHGVGRGPEPASAPAPLELLLPAPILLLPAAAPLLPAAAPLLAADGGHDDAQPEHTTTDRPGRSVASAASAESTLPTSKSSLGVASGVLSWLKEALLVRRLTNCQMCCTSSEPSGLTRKASAPRLTHNCTNEI